MPRLWQPWQVNVCTTLPRHTAPLCLGLISFGSRQVSTLPRDLFRDLDVDGNGFIDYDEFRGIVAVLNTKVAKARSVRHPWLTNSQQQAHSIIVSILASVMCCLHTIASMPAGPGGSSTRCYSMRLMALPRALRHRSRPATLPSRPSSTASLGSCGGSTGQRSSQPMTNSRNRTK